MSSDIIIDLFRHALFIIAATVAIIVVPGLLVGLLVAVFQAATQINEMTLSFLPKMLIMLMVIGLLSPWLINLLTGYTENLLTEIPYLVR